MDTNELWEDYHRNCPWHDASDDVGECIGQVTYNGHINDARYGDCIQFTCPIFFWVESLVEEKRKEG